MSTILVSSTIDESLMDELAMEYAVEKLKEVSCLNSLSSKNYSCAVLDLSQRGSKASFRALCKLKVPVITLMSCANHKSHMNVIQAGAKGSLCKTQNISDMVHKKIQVILSENVSDEIVEKEESLNLRAGKSEICSANYFQDIVEKVEDGLWVRGVDDHIIYSNIGFAEIWGVDHNDIHDVNWSDSVHPEDRDTATKEYLRCRESKQSSKIAYRIIRPDGEVRWVENKAYPILNEAGELVRRVGVVRDVTVTRELEADLLMAQKLESLGQLAAGIAHEINTPCQYLSDNLSFLIKSFKEVKSYLEELSGKFQLLQNEGSSAEVIESIVDGYQKADLTYLLEEFPAALIQSQEGIDQIKVIVQGMKGFAHPGDEAVPLNIHEAIQNTITVASNEWKSVAKIKTVFDDSLPDVTCIPSALNQSLLNLIVNAAQAIQENDDDGELGEIKISTLRVGDQVKISVADTGPGIPEEVQTKIFDPFYTTKEVGKGAGQGLSISRKIITESLSGTLKIEPSNEDGACFVIQIPIA